MPRLPVLLALGAAFLVGACGGAPKPSPPAGVDGLEIPTPSPDPADFVEQVDNPLLPLRPGNRWEYVVSGADSERTVTVTVTDETRVVQGVSTTVVQDVVRDVDGKVVEDSRDWFAQDTAGNVWSFGEDAADGSWEAGVGGARAGLVMLATPRVGDGYQQEYDPGAAEDRARVLALDEQVTVGQETYGGVLQTEDTTPLEPTLVEWKYYAPGIGLVYAETVAGGRERVELVSFTEG